MSVKTLQISKKKALNCTIHPLLYQFYLSLHDLLGAEMVHRRKRTSSMSIEIIFYCDDMLIPKGRLNTLPEAEASGFWVVCRPQTSPKHMFYRYHRVFQLFLTPVHPKKRREMEKTVTPLNAFQQENSASLSANLA